MSGCLKNRNTLVFKKDARVWTFELKTWLHTVSRVQRDTLVETRKLLVLKTVQTVEAQPKDCQRRTTLTLGLEVIPMIFGQKKNLFVFCLCPENLPEVKLKINELVSLAEENSR